MTNAAPRVGEKRPGGRAARVRADVLTAAAELLTAVGYDQMSVEDVARRAGVHKTTVYRRWPTKAELVADAVRVNSEEAVPIPDTGTVLGDLQAFAREIVANIGTEGGARRSRSIAAAAATSDELAAGMHAFWQERLAASAPIVNRAIERGELPAHTDPNLIIETVIGPLWVRLLLTGEPLSDELADRVAELVTIGATHQTHPTA
jgi:AcrR family transcriptional regulator